MASGRRFRQFRDGTGEQSGPRPVEPRSPFSFDLNSLQSNVVPRGDNEGHSILGERFPDSIFEPELQEEEEGKGEVNKELETGFVEMYSYDKLGEKPRPQTAAKGDQDWFSLTELKEELAKLRELQEKKRDSRLPGVSFRDPRESLHRLKEEAENRELSQKNTSTISFD